MGIKLRPLKRAKPPNKRAIWALLVDGVEQTNNRSAVKFHSTVATWDDQPTFNKKIVGKTPLADEITGTTKTRNQIYDWVNNGTKGPYPIPKAGPGVLVFSEGYAPKTQPGVIASGPGVRFGDTVVTSRVMHPGITPRKFDEEVKKQIEPIFKSNMETAMKKVAILFEGK